MELNPALACFRMAPARGFRPTPHIRRAFSTWHYSLPCCTTLNSCEPNASFGQRFASGISMRRECGCRRIRWGKATDKRCFQADGDSGGGHAQKNSSGAFAGGQHYVFVLRATGAGEALRHERRGPAQHRGDLRIEDGAETFASSFGHLCHHAGSHPAVRRHEYSGSAAHGSGHGCCAD